LAAVTPPAARLAIDDLGAAVRAAQNELTTAVQRGGLLNDPLRFVFGAVSTALDVMFQLFAVNAQHYRDVSDDLDRQTRDIVTRARSEIEIAQAQSIQAIATAIASTAEQALVRRVRTLDRRLALSAAGVLFGVAAVCFAGGAWWGRASAAARIARTNAGIAAAIRDRPAEAKVWLQLMQANDVQQGLQACSGQWTDPKTGRRACSMPVWLDPPQNPAPQR
jgi:hypothetical protein